MTPSSFVLGCIADDFTGATDLANNLVRAGMRVVQAIGVPTSPVEEGVDAVVVALKSRTAPVADAVAESLAALRWLPMGNVTAFGMATLFLYSTMIGAVEFCRGKWRSGSFCGTHVVLEHYYESEAFKVRCATCGRVALR